MKNYRLAENFYSKLAQDVIVSTFHAIETKHNEAIKEWRSCRWARYDRKPARPQLYKTFSVVRDSAGLIMLNDSGSSISAWRFEDPTKLSVKLGAEIFARLPESERSDIRKRAAIKTAVLGYPGNVVACFAEILLGRKPQKLARYYGQDVVDMIVGKPNNPLITQQITTIKQEIASLNAQRDSLIRQTQDDFNRHYNELYEERKRKQQDINAEFDEKVRKMEEMLAKLG